jgi:hypothetical protein
VQRRVPARPLPRPPTRPSTGHTGIDPGKRPALLATFLVVLLTPGHGGLLLAAAPRRPPDTQDVRKRGTGRMMGACPPGWSQWSEPDQVYAVRGEAMGLGHEGSHVRGLHVHVPDKRRPGGGGRLVLTTPRCRASLGEGHADSAVLRIHRAGGGLNSGRAAPRASASAIDAVAPGLVPRPRHEHWTWPDLVHAPETSAPA